MQIKNDSYAWCIQFDNRPILLYPPASSEGFSAARTTYLYFYHVSPWSVRSEKSIFWTSSNQFLNYLVDYGNYRVVLWFFADCSHY